MPASDALDEAYSQRCFHPSAYDYTTPVANWRSICLPIGWRSPRLETISFVHLAHNM